MRRSALVLLATTLGAGLSVLATSPSASAQAQNCHPSYAGACVPNVGSDDVDCFRTANGPFYVDARNFRVVGPDRYGLDADNDGIACEDDRNGGVEPTQTPNGDMEVTGSPGYPPGLAPTVVPQAPRAPTPAVQPVRGRVAFTGVDLLPWVGMGLGFLALGTALVVTARRRRA